MPHASASYTETSNGDTHMWPPGTVQLEDRNASAGARTILQPRPTTDPNDPLNWSKKRKYLNFGLACLYVIMVNEFLNAATSTWGPMHDDLGFSYEVLNDSYAVGCASIAIGAVILVPLACKFGRRPLYLLSTIFQFALSIWSAKMKTVAELMLINAIQCIFGSLEEVIVQMTISDIFFVHERGTMNSIYFWCFKLTTSLGPLIAGFIASGQGWRWVWWWNAIFFGVCIFIVGFGYEETKYCPPVSPSVPVHSEEHGYTESVCYRGADGGKMESLVIGKPATDNLNTSDMEAAPQILKQPTETELSPDIFTHTLSPDIPMKPCWERLSITTSYPMHERTNSFLNHFYQPFILLVTIPAVAYTALVYGILVGLGDVMSTTMSTLMTESPYNFSSNAIGLMNLPIIIGVTIGTILGGPTSDLIVVYLSRRNNGIFEPEYRLWAMVPFLLFIPTGAVLFAIGLNNGLSWPVIAVGFVLYFVGVAPITSITITYLTDSYKNIIGDALVAVTVVRNTFSTVFIFALTPWIDAIGVKYVFVTMLLIATTILLFVAVLIRWGKNFRARSAERYQFYALRQYTERLS
ncbi:serine/threonine kinase 16 [Penicillium angulare]|uniref:Serine/threonine kinase 16 n=1 Tax=Penicillium angulare TaxID=116970 RepID=A0A9W9KCB7_9EURO|nr:serine/threonine kinase 16 [Penicillium angulare]